MGEEGVVCGHGSFDSQGRLIATLNIVFRCTESPLNDFGLWVSLRLPSVVASFDLYPYSSIPYPLQPKRSSCSVHDV